MIGTSLRTAALSMVLALGAASAHAGVIWDYSPDTTGGSSSLGIGGVWSNMSGAQNFAERVSFAAGATATGMDIYTATGFGFVGNSVTIRIWSDLPGEPDTLLTEFTETISAVDVVGTMGLLLYDRVFAPFTNPYAFAAGVTYWIGMSGTGYELGQLGLDVNPPGDSMMYQFFGTTKQFFTASVVGDQSFRLHGVEGAAVPEPATIASALSAGLIALAFRRFRKSA